MSSIAARSPQCVFGIGLSLVLLSFAAYSADDSETQTLDVNSYRDQAGGACQIGSCVATFFATTHQKTVVNNVSCEFSIFDGDQPRVNMSITGSPDTYFLQPFIEFGNGFLTFYGVNASIVAHAVKGQSYKLYVQTITPSGTPGAAPQELTCTIAGDHS